MKTILRENGDFRILEKFINIEIDMQNNFYAEIHVQKRVSGLFWPKWETIKCWGITDVDLAGEDGDEEYEFMIREANELFDKIVQPYKI